MCLCIDVVYAMYKPFAPSASRVKSYYLFTAVVTAFTLAFFIAQAKAMSDKERQCIKEPNADALDAIPQNTILAELFILYFFVAIVSTIFALKKLYKSNFNSEGRDFFFKKQFSYVFAFTIMWQIQVLQSYYY